MPRTTWAIAAVASRFLTSVKDYATYGLQEAGISAGGCLSELNDFVRGCVEVADIAVSPIDKTHPAISGERANLNYYEWVFKLLWGFRVRTP